MGRKLLAVGAGLTTGLLVAELVLRLAGIGLPVFARPDGRYGMVLIPGATGWFRTEGQGWVSINAAGMRDVEHAATKSPDTYRIAILGDSYAEALQVSLEETFWDVMRHRISRCPALSARTVEVLNFGVSGYSQTQELLVLREKVRSYAVDAVLLAVLPANDIADNVRELAMGRPPFFVPDGLGSMRLDTTSTHSLSAFDRMALSVIRRFRLAQMINGVRLRFTAPRGNTSLGEAGLRNQVYLPPKDSAWVRAWNVTEVLIRAIRDEALAQGSRPFIATLSSGIQVHPDRATRESFQRTIGSTNLLYPDQRIAEIAESAAIPFLALAPRLRTYAESTGRHLHGWPGGGLGTGHWNTTGHRVAGEALAEWMCENITATTATGAP